MDFELSAVVWGMRTRPDGDTNKSIIGMTADEFAMLPFWDAVQRFDHVLAPFVCTATSKASGISGSGITIMQPERKLTKVIRDKDWVEDAINYVKSKSKLTTSKVIGAMPLWENIISSAVKRATIITIHRPRDEGNKSMTDMRTHKEFEHANDLYCSITQERLDKFASIPRINLVLPGGGIVRSDIAVFRCPDGPNILRFDNKTTLDILFLAQQLEHGIGKGPRSWSPKAEGVFQQAFVPSQPVNTQLACKVVRVGNPSLYFWAYAHNTDLYVSGWRSVDPEKARETPYVAGLSISKGYIIEEILVMMLLRGMPTYETWFDGRISKLQLINSMAVRMVWTGVDIWERVIGTISQRKLSKTVVIEQAKMTGFPVIYDQSLATHLKLRRPWSICLKKGRVWRDGNWVVKFASLTEKQAMLEIQRSSELVHLAGFMKVEFGVHKGAILLFIPWYGEPVSDTDRGGDAMAAIVNALTIMHRSGWHHHAIHPGNVLKNEDNQFHLIDFGHAQPAEECDKRICPDRYYLEYFDNFYDGSSNEADA